MCKKELSDWQITVRCKYLPSSERFSYLKDVNENGLHFIQNGESEYRKEERYYRLSIVLHLFYRKPKF